VALMKHIRTTVAVSAAAVMVTLPGAAHAGLISGLIGTVLPTCGTTSQPFAQFGDNNSYYPVPNQGLENGSTGWTLTGGASVVAGNEPWNVSGTGSSALALPPGSSASTPSTCINLLDPNIRLFAASEANGPLRVDVVFRGLTGNVLGILNIKSFQSSSYGDWRPSENVLSLLAVPVLTSSVQIKFTSLASSGSWKIDDVYIDPRIMW
jgi:hypothetical protein